MFSSFVFFSKPNPFDAAMAHKKEQIYRVKLGHSKNAGTFAEVYEAQLHANTSEVKRAAVKILKSRWLESRTMAYPGRRNRQ